jgi:hypothetical protein
MVVPGMRDGDERMNVLEPAENCMICDLYRVIDKHYSTGTGPVGNLVADFVTVLPPRAHMFHDLATWERVYGSPSSL